LVYAEAVRALLEWPTHAVKLHEWGTRHPAKTADPSTSLRFAQDDTARDEGLRFARDENLWWGVTKQTLR
jgi:hypothetical protein